MVDQSTHVYEFQGSNLVGIEENNKKGFLFCFNQFFHTKRCVEISDFLSKKDAATYVTFSIMTLSIMTFSITTFSIATLSI